MAWYSSGWSSRKTMFTHLADTTSIRFGIFFFFVLLLWITVESSLFIGERHEAKPCLPCDKCGKERDRKEREKFPQQFHSPVTHSKSCKERDKFPQQFHAFVTHLVDLFIYIYIDVIVVKYSFLANKQQPNILHILRVLHIQT